MQIFLPQEALTNCLSIQAALEAEQKCSQNDAKSDDAENLFHYWNDRITFPTTSIIHMHESCLLDDIQSFALQWWKCHTVHDFLK